MEWLIKRDGNQTSVPNLDSLREWARKGGLKKGDLVFHPELQRWLYAQEVLELQDAFAAHDGQTGDRAVPATRVIGQLDAAALAKNYRHLVGTVGLQLVLSLFVWSDTLTLIFLPAIIATSTALAYFAYRTAEALGSRSAALWAVAMFIPCMNMITLLALSAKATAACRAVGINVGFLGPEI